MVPGAAGHRQPADAPAPASARNAVSCPRHQRHRIPAADASASPSPALESASMHNRHSLLLPSLRVLGLLAVASLLLGGCSWFSRNKDRTNYERATQTRPLE